VKLSVLALLALLTTPAACQITPTDVFDEPIATYPLSAPPVYDSILAEVADCVGIVKPLWPLRFHIVPAAEFFVNSAGPYIGFYDSHHIYLVESLHLNPVLVKHELIHYLLAPILPGRTLHPYPPYGTCDVQPRRH
jgi:hypothetical protein